MKPNRRDAFRATLLAAAAAQAPAATSGPDPGVYSRIGVQPFINLTATYTINGGTLTLPEVKKAMEDASHYSVNLDELMEKAGARIASLLGTDSAIVTSGCAAALACATCAAVAGADPEKMQHLPDMAWFREQGLPDEVIIPKTSRNAYDHAVRSVGVRLVEVSTSEELEHAFTKRTALVAMLGTGEARSKVKLEALAQAAHKRGVPVLVDAAAELPVKPNPYLSRGADLAAYSGGKILRGPQCAGLLLGRKDLVQAAWVNSAPHHAFGRSMKVGKEEVMGMLAAIEVWSAKRDIQAEYRQWESWFAEIRDAVTKVPGVRTKVNPPAGASPFPVMEIAWDPAKIGMTAGELYDLLLNGEPRIMSHASGDGHSFIVRPVAMKPEHVKQVADRLGAIFRAASPPQNKPVPAPAASLAGRWKVDLKFAYGTGTHTMMLEDDGGQVRGLHQARAASGSVTGRMTGAEVRLRSAIPIEGTQLVYEFLGKLAGGRIEGTVTMDEYGKATFTAVRLQDRNV